MPKRNARRRWEATTTTTGTTTAPGAAGFFPKDLAKAPKAAAAVVVAVKAEAGDGDDKEAQTAARRRNFLPFVVELPGDFRSINDGQSVDRSPILVLLVDKRFSLACPPDCSESSNSEILSIDHLQQQRNSSIRNGTEKFDQLALIAAAKQQRRGPGALIDNMSEIRLSAC